MDATAEPRVEKRLTRCLLGPTLCLAVLAALMVSVPARAAAPIEIGKGFPYFLLERTPPGSHGGPLEDD